MLSHVSCIHYYIQVVTVKKTNSNISNALFIDLIFEYVRKSLNLLNTNFFSHLVLFVNTNKMNKIFLTLFFTIILK